MSSSRVQQANSAGPRIHDTLPPQKSSYEGFSFGPLPSTSSSTYYFSSDRNAHNHQISSGHGGASCCALCYGTSILTNQLLRLQSIFQHISTSTIDSILRCSRLLPGSGSFHPSFYKGRTSEGSARICERCSVTPPPVPKVCASIDVSYSLLVSILYTWNFQFTFNVQSSYTKVNSLSAPQGLALHTHPVGSLSLISQEREFFAGDEDESSWLSGRSTLSASPASTHGPPHAPPSSSPMPLHLDTSPVRDFSALQFPSYCKITQPAAAPVAPGRPLSIYRDADEDETDVDHHGPALTPVPPGSRKRLHLSTLDGNVASTAHEAKKDSASAAARDQSNLATRGIAWLRAQSQNPSCSLKTSPATTAAAGPPPSTPGGPVAPPFSPSTVAPSSAILSILEPPADSDDSESESESGGDPNLSSCSLIASDSSGGSSGPTPYGAARDRADTPMASFLESEAGRMTPELMVSAIDLDEKERMLTLSARSTSFALRLTTAPEASFSDEDLDQDGVESVATDNEEVRRQLEVRYYLRSLFER